MNPAIKHWYATFRADGLDPIRSALLAMLKVLAGDKR